jgi:hypothetical protein
MDQLSERYLEDFAVGQTFASGRLRIDGARTTCFADSKDIWKVIIENGSFRSG